MKQIWTENKINELIRLSSLTSLKEASRQLDIPYNTVRKKAQELNLVVKTFKRVDWTEQEDSHIKEHFEWAPKQYIMDLLPNRTWSAILNRGYKEFNIRRKTQDKISLDYKFFDDWNEYSAYVIGFILADGYVHIGDDQNVLQIEVALYDRDIIDKIAEILKFKGKIYEKPESVKFQTHNLRIITKLIEKGIPIKNKSYVAEYLPNIPEECERHFIRGLIDGDGWSRIDLDGNYNLGLCGTYALVSTVKDRMFYDCSDNKVRQQGPNCFRFNIKGQKAILLAEWLYEESTLYLNRKFDSYKKASEHKILRRRGNSARTRGETQ